VRAKRRNRLACFFSRERSDLKRSPSFLAPLQGRCLLANNACVLAVSVKIWPQAKYKLFSDIDSLPPILDTAFLSKERSGFKAAKPTAPHVSALRK